MGRATGPFAQGPNIKLLEKDAAWRRMLAQFCYHSKQRAGRLGPGDPSAPFHGFFNTHNVILPEEESNETG